MKLVLYLLLLFCFYYSGLGVVYGESYYLSSILGNDHGDGGLATDAPVYPSTTYVAPNGEIYIAQNSFHIIRKVSLNGTITRFAGNGKSGVSGDGGLALNAAIGSPWGMVLDSNGNFYFSDYQNNVIRKINTNGIISTFAGTGASGKTGDGGQAIIATFNNPSNLAIDSNGNMYISDTFNSVIRKINTNGIISTIAGGKSGNLGPTFGDGNLALNSQIPSPYGIAVGPSGAIYIADTTYSTVRKVVIGGTITKVAGTTSYAYDGDSGTATSLSMRAPYGVAVDPDENVYIADTFNSIIRRVYPDGTMNTIAGTPVVEGFIGDGGLATSAVIHYPRTLDYHSGKIIFSDYKNCRVRSVDLTSGKISTVAGNGFGTKKSAAMVVGPIDMAFAPDGSMVFCDLYSVGKMSTDGTITRLAGLIGLNGNSADGSILNSPRGVVIDSSGQIYFSDNENHLIRKIATNGVVSIIAGTGTPGFSGDGGQALSAKLKYPRGLAFDSSGKLYVADSNNHAIRKIDTNTGIITTIAGTGSSGYTGDGGQASSATLSYVNNVVFDSVGQMYLTDSGNFVIRKISTGGVITTIAGTGSLGFGGGDGGLATLATFVNTVGLVVDSTGQVFISDSFTHSVRKISTNGIISKVVGSGNIGYDGEDVLGTISSLFSPQGLAINTQGQLVIADMGNNRIRVLTLGHVCFGKSGASACGGKGLCDELDTCICNSGWSGSECSTFVCNGLNNCNGHGTCISNNTCTCSSGWKGNNQCSSFSCDGLNNCNGHGTCISNNTCTCNSGWKGSKDCLTFSCDGQNNCSGTGSCISNNTCNCTSGWTGSNCSTPIVNNVNNPCTGIICLNNGSCNGGICNCTQGWTGSNCSTQITNNVINPCTGIVCLNNGSCNNGICNCTTGWKGTNCSIQSTIVTDPCSGISCLNNGSCISGICNCTQGWTGSNCSTQITNNVINPCTGIICLNNGSCNGGICNCTSGWTGSNCATQIVNNVINPCTGIVCLNNGTCNNGICNCTTGWKGTNCSIPSIIADSCYGVVCVNNGSCISGKCNCTNGWIGSNCSTPITNNTNNLINPCSGIVCLNNGSCNSGKCNCTSGWTGSNCSTPITNVTNNIINPCTGIICLNNGSCISGKCNCTQGWTGSNCSTPITNNVINPCSNVFCLHGSCISSGKCNCTQGWMGSSCNISSYSYPVANLIIPQVVSQCDSVIFDSSQSTPSDGSLSFSWLGLNGPSLDKLNTMLIGLNSSIVNIDTSNLNIGFYSIQVKITNWLGASSAVANFTVSPNGVPTISFSWYDYYYNIGSIMTITPTITLPTCYTGNGNISYSYSYIDPNYNVSDEIPLSSNMLVLGVTNGLQANIPGGYMIFFNARANGAETAVKSLYLWVQGQPINVHFSIPDLSQSQYTNISFSIKTYDPSNTNEQSSLMTVCQKENGNVCQSPGTMSTFSASFPPGTYKFTTTFTKGSRQATDKIYVTVLSAPISAIIRVSINTNDVNKDQVPSTTDFVIGYSTLDKLSSSATFLWTNSFGVQSTSSILTIPSSKLYPGTFNITLSVTDGQRSGVADLQFTVPPPPVAGTCISQPSSGKALQTKFSFSCTGWSSTVSDIRYNYFKASPSGSYVLLKVEGSDTTGATTTYYFNVQVNSVSIVQTAEFFKQLTSTDSLSGNIVSLAISALSGVYDPSPTEIQMFKIYVDQIVTKLRNTISQIQALTGDYTEELSKEVLGVVSSISSVLPKGLVSDTTISNILHTLSESLINALLKSNIQLKANDLNVISSAIKKVVIYIQTQTQTSKRAFSNDDLKLINGIIGNIATLSTKNTMPDSPATVLNMNGITTTTRKVNIALLDSLVQNSSSTGTVKFSSSFSSLPEIIDIPVVTLTIQESSSSSIANAATSIIQLSISSDGVNPLKISSNSAIASLKFAFKASRRSIEAYNTICNSVSVTGSISVASGCNVIIGTDGTATASITETGSYVLTTTLINTPTILPSPTESNSTNTDTNTNNMSTLLIAVLLPVFSAVLLLVLVITIFVLLYVLRRTKKVHNDIELSGD